MILLQNILLVDGTKLYLSRKGQIILTDLSIRDNLLNTPSAVSILGVSKKNDLATNTVNLIQINSSNVTFNTTSQLYQQTLYTDNAINITGINISGNIISDTNGIIVGGYIVANNGVGVNLSGTINATQVGISNSGDITVFNNTVGSISVGIGNQGNIYVNNSVNGVESAGIINQGNIYSNNTGIWNMANIEVINIDTDYVGGGSIVGIDSYGSITVNSTGNYRSAGISAGGSQITSVSETTDSIGVLTDIIISNTTGIRIGGIVSNITGVKVVNIVSNTTGVEIGNIGDNNTGIFSNTTGIQTYGTITVSNSGINAEIYGIQNDATIYVNDTKVASIGILNNGDIHAGGEFTLENGTNTTGIQNNGTIYANYTGVYLTTIGTINSNHTGIRVDSLAHGTIYGLYGVGQVVTGGTCDVWYNNSCLQVPSQQKCYRNVGDLIIDGSSMQLPLTVETYDCNSTLYTSLIENINSITINNNNNMLKSIIQSTPFYDLNATQDYTSGSWHIDDIALS